MGNRILHLDFESQSPVDIKRAGADVYARHPQCTVMATGFAFDDEDVRVNPIHEIPDFEVVEHVASGGKVVAHSAQFELAVWNYAWRREFPSLPPLKLEQTVCTSAMAYAMGLPGSLGNAAAAAGIDFQKDMKGQRVMLQLATPKEDGTFYKPDEVPEKWAEMYSYCKIDVEVERGLYKRLVKLTKKEQRVWELDQIINQRGVAIDFIAVKRAIELVEFEKNRLDTLMRELTDDDVATCTATAQLTKYLKFQGFDVEGVAKNDITELLGQDDLPEKIKKILELRREAAKSSTAKLASMINGMCDDGRVRGLFQYHGAGTGRWAGRRIQLQNLPRPNLSQGEIEDVLGLLRSN